MNKKICMPAAVFFFAIFLAGCKIADADSGKDLQRLCLVEVYGTDGELIKAVEDEDSLRAFNECNLDSGALDFDEEQQAKLADEAGKHEILYTFVSYKTPAALWNDGKPEKLKETVLYKDTGIVKEQIAPETVKSMSVPARYLTFYYTVSEKQQELYRSIAGGQENREASQE